jgi:hypothetical protein
MFFANLENDSTELYECLELLFSFLSLFKHITSIVIVVPTPGFENTFKLLPIFFYIFWHKLRPSPHQE